MTIRGLSIYTGHQIKIPIIVLLGLMSCMLALYFSANLRADKVAHLAMSLVFLCAALSSLWDRRQQLSFGSNILSLGLGTCIVAGILYQSFRSPAGWYLAFAPVVAAIGVMLLASGYQAIGQYRTELLTLFCLGLPKLLLKFIPDISPFTAQFSTYLLWYSGFSVRLTDNLIQLPDGAVRVVPSCSGLNLMTYMFAITLIFLLMFPLPTTEKIIAPIVAVTLGFFINGIRVALLALLSTQNNPALFDYWHSNDGALLFVMLTVLLFGLFCWWIVCQTQGQSPEEAP
ncbi:cyanoexosortase A [Acaryochloris sp. IP29b_bin.137]|uniref:cyanoexosortase A n=1 Tax=Acaryochloris sp. IP29b_bin.137 TaxID=2969217 RepID=UPI0026146B5C|nr:cyanoexosortase A [Acaryochloris sp. IP29b_bin.137]